ncbi:hypothetical protein PsYK624_122610 [Phanerochaete sordida]|uniref:Uncharacterized protein n=1 Tax=Phanerochaete sordida TaxID=48140 RepID=A0A9P3GJH0_9APHY|nr:hypothetical protein PsYK624_122610 [Phanerochaete sordida]
MDALLCVSTGTWSTVPLTLRALKCASFLQADSYCEQQLRFAGAQALFEAYINTSDGIRTGKRMEHLNSLASSIAYKCMPGPVKCIAVHATLSFYLVTASVDRLGMMLAYMSPVPGLRLSSQSVYVGHSSIYDAVRIEALNSDGPDETVVLGRFCTVVCRDSKTHRDGTFCSTTRTSSLVFCPRGLSRGMRTPDTYDREAAV